MQSETDTNVGEFSIAIKTYRSILNKKIWF